MEKQNYKKLDVMQPRMKNKYELPVGEWTIPDHSQPLENLQSWLIKTVYHLLVKNNKREGNGGGGGEGGLKKWGSLLTLFPWKGRGEGFNRGFMVHLKSCISYKWLA